MLVEVESLGLKFTLPDRLTVDQLDAMTIARNQKIGALNGTTTWVRYYAVVYGVVADQGVITDWQCERMPDPKPAEVGAADAAVIVEAGRAINDWLDSFTAGLAPKRS